MTIDFSLISMTELRTKPGEILDRVANEGEAFVIESNGRRKACLVPVSLFLPDVSPSRLSDEIQDLLDQGEELQPTFTENKEIAFKFTHSLSDGTEISLRILLPHGYPNKSPIVYADPLKSNSPHRWPTGALCLYGATTKWNPGKHTVLSTLDSARYWLKQYDDWLQTGLWVQKEQLIND